MYVDVSEWDSLLVDTNGEVGIQHGVHSMDDTFAAWVVGEGCSDGKIL